MPNGDPQEPLLNSAFLLSTENLHFFATNSFRGLVGEAVNLAKEDATLPNLFTEFFRL